ncbi:hypothetical protein [Streptomyces sp. NPDC096132]|uniref:hypothetical protein n=1 Tax=Streptomyces sp. NPDC096132 TaxID=3366075 RepID=UPI003806DD8A
MRDGAWTGWLVLAALLTGCQAAADDDPSPPPTATPTPRAPTVVSGFGRVFLDAGECSSFGTTSFTEVPCAGERAAARVTARHDGKAGTGPPCPPTTDFVLHIGEQPAEHGAIAQGYACMRNLQPPHPGDPGAGGGPRTIVGDCVHGTGNGQVRETACDGSGTHAPQYEVAKAVDTRANCPASTALYVQLGGSPAVGCARPV